MKKPYQCVSHQIQYLILAAMLPDEEYMRYGVNVRNVLILLAGNKRLWEQAGHRKAGKSFEKRLDWALSILEKEGALANAGKRQFRPGPNFHAVMARLLADIIAKLNLSLDYNHLTEEQQEQLERNPQLFIPALASGNIVVELLSSVSDEPVHLFTEEQIMRLAEHSIVFQLSVPSAG